MQRFLALCLALYSPSIGAATIEVAPAQGDAPAIVLVDGILQAGDFESFQFKIAGIPKAVVVLRSDGGNLLTGIQIGRLIRLRGYFTVVPSDVRCASACAIAWLGGAQRYMGATAHVGFHAAYRNEDGRETETGAGNALLGAYLNQIGLNEVAIFYVTKAPPNQMTWLTLSDAANHGIQVHLFPETPAAVAADGSSGSAPTQPNLEVRTKQFIVSLFEQWSSSTLDITQLVNAAYAEQTYYHGKLATKDDLIADKRAFVQRWPLRRYTVREPSLAVRCSNEAACTASGLSDWAAFNPHTMKRARGIAEVQYAVNWALPTPRIYLEHGKVVERGTEPIRAAEIGPGWWVVAGAFKASEADPAISAKVETDVRWATGRAYLCGVNVFADMSANFRNFAPGYKIVVAGPFAAKTAAAQVQRSVSDCIAGAYIKHATR